MGKRLQFSAKDNSDRRRRRRRRLRLSEGGLMADLHLAQVSRSLSSLPLGLLVMLVSVQGFTVNITMKRIEI